MCLGLAGFAQAAPAGSVIDVAGEVTLTRNAARLKVSLFDNLFAGDVIQVPQGAKLVLTHNATKKEYAIAAPGEFEVGADDIKPKGGARLQTKNLNELAMVSLGSEAGKGRATVGAVRMRGAAPPVTSPLDGETVLTQTPALSWPAMPGVERYQVTLRKSGGDVLVETAVDQPQYRIESASLLEWGGRYQWSVAGEQDGRRSLLVKSFSLIERADRETLERMKPAPDGEFSAWVVYAKALEHLGALSEARTVWAKLAAQRPDLSVLEGLAKGK
jgi:hypothetical protein